MKRYIATIPARARYWLIRLRDLPSMLLRPSETLRFRCNVCGSKQTIPIQRLSREGVSCRCGSTVRFRSLILLLSSAIYGKPYAIPDMPKRPEIVGLDMSGAHVYAARLGERLGYMNTYFHQPPKLDILSPPKAWLGRFDFVLSSDVFEHVLHPILDAFVNTLNLLKPGGILILTVPYRPDGETVEHYPDLFDYDITGQGSNRMVVNTTRDGQVQKFPNPVFHGGNGATLEMRVFSLPDLLKTLRDAGFTEIEVHSEDVPEYGIAWEHPWSLPITARRPLK